MAKILKIRSLGYWWNFG